MRYITFALAKGRLAKKAMALLEEIGITCEEMKDEKTRKLIFVNEELKLKFFLSKASDVPTYVEYGAADIGVVGKDKYAEAIMDSISKLDIDKNHIRIDERYQTANNMTYLTESGDRYYKDDSWNGEILDNIVLNDNEIKILSRSDVVFVHFWASCFSQVVELKETLGFKLAVDFDVYRDFADMERFAPHVDFFMISGSEELLPRFKELSNKYRCLFNVSLAERGSVTYFNGQEFKVQAVKVERIIDTTGCGDSYHAGFVCSYMLENNIEKAMNVGSEIAAETLKHYGGF